MSILFYHFLVQNGGSDREEVKGYETEDQLGHKDWFFSAIQ